jgi:heme oxygenase
MPKPANAKNPEPAYQIMAPIYDDKIMTNVYDRAMDSQITLTQCEQLSLLPEVHSQVCEAVSTKQTTPKEATQEIHTLTNDDSLPFTLNDLKSKLTNTATTTLTFMQSVYHQKVPPPPGSLIPDPYETYLKSLPNGQTLDTLVTKESSALRSIFPLVDHQQHVESIIDPGLQIIAIAEEVCIDLGLNHYPQYAVGKQRS